MNIISKFFGQTTIKIKPEDQFWERDQYQPTSNISQRRESIIYGNNSQPLESIFTSNDHAYASNLNNKITRIDIQNSQQQSSFNSNEKTQDKNGLKALTGSHFFKKRAEMVRKNQSNDTREELGIPLINSVAEYSNLYTNPKPMRSIIQPKVHTRVGSDTNFAQLRKREKTPEEPRRQTFEEMETNIRQRLLNDDTPNTSISIKRTPIFQETKSHIKPLKSAKIQSSPYVSQNQGQNATLARSQIFAKSTIIEKNDKQNSPIQNNLITKPKQHVQTPSQLKDLDTLLDEDRKLTEEIIGLEMKNMNQQKDPRNLNLSENTFATLLGNHSDEIKKFKTLEKSRNMIIKEITLKKNSLLELQSKRYFVQINESDADFKEKERIIYEVEKIKAKIRNQKHYIENFEELTAEKAFKFRDNSERVINQNIEMAFIDIRNSEDLLYKELKHYDQKL